MIFSLPWMNGMQQWDLKTFVITRNLTLVIVNIKVIATLANFVCFWDSSEAALLHHVILYLVFMGAEHTYMRYSYQGVNEFHVLFKLPFKEVVAYSIFFKLCFYGRKSQMDTLWWSRHHWISHAFEIAI